MLIGLLAGALVSVGNWFSDLLDGGNVVVQPEADRRRLGRPVCRAAKCRIRAASAPHVP